MFPQTTLFFAITGTQRDGHRFISDCYEKGVCSYVVEREVDTKVYPGAGFIVVNDSVAALQQIAAHHRQLFELPVIGITGSNGKTIVKEWLAQLLTPEFAVAKSPKSYNSQIGVPLSVWRLGPHHGLGIFEAGVSQRGEMEKLEPIIKPTIGVFTNIGSAHAAGFRSLEEKIAEKLKLFDQVKVLVYCADHDPIHDAVKSSPLRDRSLTWSRRGRGDIGVTVTKADHAARVNIQFDRHAFEFELPFTDDISIENALHCFAVMTQLDVDLNAHLPRFKQLHNLPLRLELKKAAGGSTLIYDCYNADLDSLALALDFMQQHDAAGNRTVILSDLLQSGLERDVLYGTVAQLLERRGIHSLIGIGREISGAFSSFRSLNATFYTSTADFIRDHPVPALANQTILLKGARAFQFERIGHHLERQVHQTVLEIDLNALAHNLSVYKGRLDEGVKVMVMVKALSYGAGSYEIAQLLQFHQVDYLAVAYTDEGIELRQSGIRLPVMVMNPSPGDLHLLIEHRLEPEVFHLEGLRLYLGEVGASKSPAPPAVHLKLETGMHRLGLTAAELGEALAILKAQERVRVASVFSHLAASDSSHYDAFTLNQFNRFGQMASQVSAVLGYMPLRHILNSSGIVRFPEHQYDMVRLGIGLYGVDTSGSVVESLQPISTLRTVVSQVKDVSEGESVGYERAFIAAQAMRIAALSIGYADGFRRSLGNGRAQVMIRGERVPTVGNICMDMTMVDVSHLPECAVGDEVEVFGKNISVAEVARWAGTNAYEIISTVSSRVKRVYLEE